MKTQALMLLSLTVGILAILLPHAVAAEDTPPAKSSSKVIPVALVGCAHIHTPAFIATLKRRAAEFQVKCVWDHDAARAAKRAAELGVPVVDDLAKVWSDPEIKAVIICSETDRHLELVTAAAQAHKHIYAEKPLGMGATDAYGMANAIKNAGVLFETGYFMRGDDKILFLKDQIAHGHFGKITRIHAANCHSGALGGWFDGEWRWMADPKVAGIGGFGDLGTHSLDIMLWLLGNVKQVTAAVSSGTARYPGCDETGEGLLLFDNGAIGVLSAAWDDVANPVTLEICGTEGHATVVNNQLFYQSQHVDGADGKKPWTQLPPGQAHPLDLFLDAVAGQKEVPLVTAGQAAYRSAVMEALYQGARQQQWTTPARPPE